MVDNVPGRTMLVRNGAMVRFDEPGVLAFEILLARVAPTVVAA
jgi:hypothetical protein